MRNLEAAVRATEHGHTVFATNDEAQAECLDMLELSLVVKDSAVVRGEGVFSKLIRLAANEEPRLPISPSGAHARP
jgi:hypothetical protein